MRAPRNPISLVLCKDAHWPLTQLKFLFSYSELHLRISPCTPKPLHMSVSTITQGVVPFMEAISFTRIIFVFVGPVFLHSLLYIQQQEAHMYWTWDLHLLVL